MRQYLIYEDKYGSDTDETIGKVEDSKGPSLGVEEYVFDNMTIDEAVDDIAERASDDHGETEMGDKVSGAGASP